VIRNCSRRQRQETDLQGPGGHLAVFLDLWKRERPNRDSLWLHGQNHPSTGVPIRWRSRWGVDHKISAGARQEDHSAFQPDAVHHRAVAGERGEADRCRYSAVEVARHRRSTTDRVRTPSRLQVCRKFRAGLDPETTRGQISADGDRWSISSNAPDHRGQGWEGMRAAALHFVGDDSCNHRRSSSREYSGQRAG
jgi:hypothetical protein